jgi:hypothetical protein
MTEWKPRNKYEVAPGLFIGSEIGDIDREKRPLLKKWLETGDKDAFADYMKLSKRREELLMPKFMRK